MNGRGFAQSQHIQPFAQAQQLHTFSRDARMDRAVGLVRAPRDRDDEGLALLAQALYYGPTPADEARDRCREFLEEARTTSEPSLRAVFAEPSR